MTERQRGAPVERPFRCAYNPCGVEELSVAIPKGWYGVRQYPGDHSIRPINLGIYHSLACLAAAASDMAERASEVSA